MKKSAIIIILILLPLLMMAQHEEDTENGVVSLAGKEGFTIGSKKGDFLFKPYLLVQTSATVNYYDDEGLDKAYNQDNVANSGFAIPYAILGFTGKAFNKVTYNLSINAAASGGGLCFSKPGLMYRSRNSLPCGPVNSRPRLPMLI